MVQGMLLYAMFFNDVRVQVIEKCPAFCIYKMHNNDFHYHSLLHKFLFISVLVQSCSKFIRNHYISGILFHTYQQHASGLLL